MHAVMRLLNLSSVSIKNVTTLWCYNVVCVLHAPWIHANNVRVIITDVFEDFQHSLGTEEDFLLLVIVVDLDPLSRQL